MMTFGQSEKLLTYTEAIKKTTYKDIPIDADSDFRIIGEVVGKYSEN